MSTDDYENPVPGKTYISPRLKSFGKGDKRVRLVSKVMESREVYAFGTVKKELIVRERPGGKTHIRATVIEEPRGISVLNIQGWTVATDKPHNASFSFVGEEIRDLFDFIQNILEIEFKTSRPMKITDEELKCLVVSDQQARRLFAQNQEIFASLARSEITKEDVVALGYRKRQLSVFENLLSDEEYFEDIQKRKDKTVEGLWQEFFEKNAWIFGYGLSYLHLSGLDEKKLEQVISGYSLSTHGKRVDALMKTKGLISSLCFVEIKTHETSLLEPKPYRSGCWAVSRDLSGAVAQVQGTVASAVESIRTKINPKNELGEPTDEELFNLEPRSFLVVGTLGEFVTDKGTNDDKFRSFELFRRSLRNPEIITFDELYERAKFIVQTHES